MREDVMMLLLLLRRRLHRRGGVSADPAAASWGLREVGKASCLGGSVRELRGAVRFLDLVVLLVERWLVLVLREEGRAVARGRTETLL